MDQLFRCIYGRQRMPQSVCWPASRWSTRHRSEDDDQQFFIDVQRSQQTSRLFRQLREMQLALNAFGRYTASHFSPYTVKAKYVMITVFEFLTVTNIGDQLATSSERTSPCGTLQRRSFIKYGETALINRASTWPSLWQRQVRWGAFWQHDAFDGYCCYETFVYLPVRLYHLWLISKRLIKTANDFVHHAAISSWRMQGR